ncbi:hypothetical protein L218DRAFT_947086 [Marasmius fiardii PR-910]|nr:hypothetical protein L218DRAFT_947086 [Marasmius fiardii PR-910]
MVRASAWPDLLHFFLCLVLHSSSSVQALPKTRTIDDTFGDLANPDIQTPIYNGNWIARRGSECSNSTGCSDIVPNNANLIVNGTWHEALHSPTQPEPSTLHLSFNELIPGTALSVFCILPARTIIRGGGTSNIVWPLYLNFLLDSQPAESFNRTPDQLTDSFQYNVSVFSRDNLENKAHTFIIALNDPLNDSFVLFDYASYVYDDDTVKAKFKASLVGYIFVGLASGMGFLMFIWYLKSRLLDALKATEYSYRFNSPAQPSYLELLGDTRSQYIYGVLSDWAHTRLPKKGSAGAGIYWLQGSESSWRSAVAQKLAKECEEKELLSTFFFSTEDPNRNTPRYLTLAIAHEMMATSSFGTRNSHR